MAVRLTAYPGVIGRGNAVGIKATNLGRATLGWGYGEDVERKTERGWVEDHIYRKHFNAWILPLLIIGPGESRGPDIGTSGSMSVVVSRNATPGLYRITKHFQGTGKHRGSGLNATVKFRISAKELPVPTTSELTSNFGVRRDGDVSSRLTLGTQVVEPGNEVSMTVENLGSVPLTFGRVGKLFRRGDAPGQWNAVRGTGITASDIYKPEELIRLEPGETAGPGFDTAVGKVDMPSNLRAGHYRITTFVNGPKTFEGPRSLEISAPIRVTE